MQIEKIFRVPALILAVALVISVAGCGKRVPDGEQFSAEEKIVVRFSHVVPRNTPKGLAARRFASLVEERTRGQVEVQVFPNSTLFKDGEELDALRENKVQFIAPSTSKLGEMFPRWQLFDLPYAFSNRQEIHRAVEGEIWEKLCQNLEKQNMKALAFWDNGFKQLTNDKREIIHPGDLRGLNFRVMINSQVLEDQFRVLGAVPVPMVFSELYRGLENGAVDGQENTISNIYAKKLYQVQSHLTVSNHGYLGYVVLTNTEFWENLSPEIRRIMGDTMAEVTAWERQKAEELNSENLEQLMKSEKMDIHIQTAEEKEEWIRSLKPVYRYYESVIGQGFLNRLESMKRDGLKSARPRLRI